MSLFYDEYFLSFNIVAHALLCTYALPYESYLHIFPIMRTIVIFCFFFLYQLILLYLIVLIMGSFMLQLPHSALIVSLLFPVVRTFLKLCFHFLEATQTGSYFYKEVLNLSNIVLIMGNLQGLCPLFCTIFL